MRMLFSKLGITRVKTGLQVAYRITIATLLTVVTQVGGVVYLLSLTFSYYVIRKFRFTNPMIRITTRTVVFVCLYLVVIIVIIPPAAKPFGRIPLPVTATNNVQPLTIWTALLNRHYVNEELYDVTLEAGEKMADRFPGTILNYLDAGFPFLDKFPLFPHLSHHDGKKLDLALMYKDSDGRQSNKCPSPIGYGIGVDPEKDERNAAIECRQKGFWQYDLLFRIMPQHAKRRFTFDEERTRYMINYFTNQPNIRKILLEPHLKTRLRLASSKIRFHGCHAVRHDDHIHIQL